MSMPLFLVPKQSHAGILGDLLHELFGNGQNQNGQGQNNNNQGQDNGHDHSKWGDKNDPAASNSVPLNEGTILLVMAGLVLGTVMLLRANSKNLEIASQDGEVASA